jgi:hypothetical protein
VAQQYYGRPGKAGLSGRPAVTVRALNPRGADSFYVLGAGSDVFFSAPNMLVGIIISDMLADSPKMWLGFERKMPTADADGCGWGDHAA